MGSHLLGLANSSQLQYSKHFKMKLPMIIAATVAVGLAGPQHLRSYSVGSHLRGRYDGQAYRSQGLRTYSNYQNYRSKTPVPFSEPYRLDGPISPGPQFTGNYVGKQLDQVAVLPAAASGLAYMRAYFDKNDLCGTSGLAYMETILSGGSGVQAQANAEAAYKAAWARGGRIVPGSACAASEVAFKEAYASGNGRATIESALAFVNRDAMVAFINQAVNDREAFFDPVCGAATIAWLDEKIAGKSDKEAGAASAEAYIEAFAANGGKRTEACKRSAEAYIKTF